MKISKKLINKFSRNKNHLQYEGPFETWREAKDKSIGYDSDVVLKKVQQAVINVLDGNYKYERDGTNFESLPSKNTLIDELSSSESSQKLKLSYSVIKVKDSPSSSFGSFKKSYFSKIFTFGVPISSLRNSQAVLKLIALI